MEKETELLLKIMLEQVLDDSPIPDLIGEEAYNEAVIGAAEVFSVDKTDVSKEQLKAFMYYGKEAKLLKNKI